MEAVLAQIAKPGQVVEPINLKKNHQTNLDEEHVYRVVCIPLWGWLPLHDAGSDRSLLTPYRLGANAWKDYTQGDSVNALVFVLQLMMLLVESTSLEGGYICNVNRDTNPNEYHRVCVATAKTIVGGAKKEDWKLRSTHVITGRQVDLRFVHDVNHEKLVLAASEKQKKKNSTKNQKNQKKQKKKRVKITDHQIVDKMMKACGIDDFLPCGGDHHGVTYFRDEYDDDNEDERVEGEEDEGEEEAEEDEGEAAFVEKAPYTGPPGAVEKISMHITEIPHSEDENEIVGMMVTFIIRDPSINPGVFYKHCMENLAMRAARKLRYAAHALKAEMFPEYEEFMLSFWPAGNRTNIQTYAHIVRSCYPDFIDQYYNGREGNFYSSLDIEADTPAHIYNLFTPEFAIQKLREVGGSSDILGRASDWVDRREGVVRFPQSESARTWKPSHLALVWYSKEHCGFYNHHFPFVDMNSDFLRALRSGVRMTEFLAGTSDALRLKKTRIEKMLEKDVLVLKSLVSAAKNELGYETSNEIVHATFESDAIYSSIKEYYPEIHYHETLKEVQELSRVHGRERWRLFLKPELESRVEECELYNTVLKTAQEAMRKTFYNIIKLDENPDALKISDPLKKMIAWYQSIHETKLPNMTRPYRSIDPELDPFGNTMLQQLFIFTRFAKALQPMVCILSEGLFSCYDAFQAELSYNQMISGKYDSGKTFTAIGILINFTTIPGTITEQPLATKASDTTHKHSHDEIIAIDECPEWMVSDAEAKKNPDLVNKEKVKMTRGRLTQKTFVWLDLPSGRKLRWNEDVTTDHKKSIVVVSNHAQDSKKALSSRFHRFIMKEPTISPSEVKGYVDEAFKNESKIYLHINQFLSALSKKLAACGGIIPEVELELFDDISVRVLKYLKQVKAVSQDAGPRSLEIVKPFLRQLVYKMAIRYAFDFEWSENYKRKFSLDQLPAIQPFLYVTVSQIWFVLTACASEWINDDYCNVLRAMVKEACPVWVEGASTPYSVYERDVQNNIKFKTHVNEIPAPNSGVGEQLPQDKFIIDINYMCLEGNEDMIAQKVQQHTNPRLEPDQIKAIFKRLSEIQKRPEDGGFAPQRMGTFAKWHKYSNNDPGATKFTGNSCVPEYLILNNSGNIPRARGDVPPLQDGVTLPIVDRSDLRKNKLYFMPGMESYFQQNIMLEALRFATYCSTTRPGKILLGFTARENTTRLDVELVREDLLNDYLLACDQDCGFTRRYDGSWKSDDPDAVSRITDGIVFNRCAAFTDFDVAISSNLQMAPSKLDDDEEEERATRAANGAKAMSKDREIVRDLDVRSAERQHMRCGRPLDEPVRTPQWIAEKTGNKTLGLDYFFQDGNEKQLKELKWKKTNTVGPRALNTRKKFEETKNMSRQQYQAHLAQKQAQEMQRSVVAVAPDPTRRNPALGQKRGRERTNSIVFGSAFTSENNE